MKKLFIISISFFIILFLFRYSTGSVFARAGGGEYFGGSIGSSGLGSIGGIGSGGGFGNMMFIPLLMGGNWGSGSGTGLVITIILLFVIVPFFIRKFGMTNSSNMTGSPSMFMQQMFNEENTSEVDVSIIQKVDAEFSLEEFYSFVKNIFIEVQNSYSKKIFQV